MLHIFKQTEHNQIKFGTKWTKCIAIVLLKLILIKQFEQAYKATYTLKMLGCFNPTLGQIWTNPAIGLHFLIAFLTQRLGLSIFDPKLG